MHFHVYLLYYSWIWQWKVCILLLWSVIQVPSGWFQAYARHCIYFTSRTAEQTPALMCVLSKILKHAESYELNHTAFSLCFISYWSRSFSFFMDLRITLLLSVFQMPVHVNVLSYEARLNRVISSVQFIVDYDYDTEQELWCKMKLAVSMFLDIIIVLSQP